MKQMQGLDASFVALERPNAPLHIGSIIIYDPSTAPGGFVRFKDILRFVEGRLHLAKSMRQRMVRVPLGIDHPYWIEDPDFDLEYHVRHVALPKPGDWRQLCIQAARVFSRPLDLTRPPWEITIVEGLDNVDGAPEGSYAMLSKVHHAGIDGLSGIDMMHALNSLSPDVTPPDIADEWKPDDIPNKMGLFAKGYVRAWTNPVRQLNHLRRSVPGIYKATRSFAKGEFDIDAVRHVPRTRFNDKITAHRTIDACTFSLSDIKKLRALSVGSKVNDVMLAIVGGGLNKYLKAKEELPSSSLVAMAPISVREEDEKGSMGNQVSAMFAPLGSHISHPKDRMQYVHGETLKSKKMTNALGARQMTEVSKSTPALYLGLGARLYTQLGLANRMKPVINTVVTNVPGPPIPIYSAGAQMVNMFGNLCLLDGMGLGHVVHSYVDKVTVCFTACRKAIPDPSFYASCLQESFEEMLRAANNEIRETNKEEGVTATEKPSKKKRKITRVSEKSSTKTRLNGKDSAVTP